MKLSFIQDIAGELGLSIVGYTDLRPLETDRAKLAAWQEAGCAAGMAFMLRDPSLLTAPATLFPEAKSILSIGLPYDCAPLPPPREGHGRIARYAWGKDYHLMTKDVLRPLVDTVSKHSGKQISYRAFADSVPLLERAVAARACLGVIGRNTLLIRKGEGSFLFLAEILWDMDIEDDMETFASAACEGCRLCLSNCPTNALVNDYVLDARKCISYLTIEKRGLLDKTERASLGEWIFGCDICQDKCPANFDALRSTRRSPFPSLRFEEGPGPFLNLEEVLRIRTNADFKARYKDTALLRAKREGLLRNAAIVAANIAAQNAIGPLIESAQEDASEVVRAHAIAAIVKLQANGAIMANGKFEEVMTKARADSAAAVRTEASMA